MVQITFYSTINKGHFIMLEIVAIYIRKNSHILDTKNFASVKKISFFITPYMFIKTKQTFLNPISVLDVEFKYGIICENTDSFTK
jgi:hypothetical protein